MKEIARSDADNKQKKEGRLPIEHLPQVCFICTAIAAALVVALIITQVISSHFTGIVTIVLPIIIVIAALALLSGLVYNFNITKDKLSANKLNFLAIVGLICSITSAIFGVIIVLQFLSYNLDVFNFLGIWTYIFMGLFAILGLIIGIISFRRIKQHKKRKSVLAISVIVISAIMLFATISLLCILLLIYFSFSVMYNAFT